jgi:1D-myo-inositol-triphosphate 3-kinase
MLQVSETILRFTQGNNCVCNKFLSRLREIRSHFESSEYFKNHEIIGSSLLFLYDKDNQANIWMIDFAKTISIKDGKLNHRSEWRLGNHEDGYLIGLDNLIQIFEELCSRNTTSNSVNCNDNNPPSEAKQWERISKDCIKSSLSCILFCKDNYSIFGRLCPSAESFDP